MASRVWWTWRARWPTTRPMNAPWRPPFRRQEEGTAPLAGFTVRPERVEIGGSFAQPMITVGRAERSMPVYGDVALNQYFDLVERMAALPGKKSIVLMRPGLRLEPDNVGMLLDLSSFAVRKRVSFYTVDSRGLESQLPADEKFVPFMIDRRTRRTEPDLIGQLETAALARDGLQSLARETGGKMLIGTNKLSEIFDRVAHGRLRATTSSATTRSTCARRAASAR